MLRALPLLVSLLLSLLFVPACGDGRGGTGGALGDAGSVVVGVVSNLRVGVDFHAMHVVMKVGASTVRDDVQNASAGLSLPAELAFDDLPAGAPVHVEIEALVASGSSFSVLVTRTADTTVVRGRKLFLRLALDTSCVKAIGSAAAGCAETETCIGGVCADPVVDPALLPDYVPGWADGPSDPCKPAGGGAPVVIVGQGQGDYLPTMDGVTAQVEAGPQGGHHIWVAARMKHLAQSGSITSVTGHFPDLGIDVGPFDVIFTFDTDEGGYCKLYGLRFQLDQVHPIEELLGQKLDVKVKITDPKGAVGEGARRVTLSSDFIQ
jgi:hypothetical protein